MSIGGVANIIEGKYEANACHRGDVRATKSVHLEGGGNGGYCAHCVGL